MRIYPTLQFFPYPMYRTKNSNICIKLPKLASVCILPYITYKPMTWHHVWLSRCKKKMVTPITSLESSIHTIKLFIFGHVQ